MSNLNTLKPYFLKATEEAAIASAKWRGKGDRKAADAAAVKAMRKVFDDVPFDGKVAIGEGERDEAPMLYIGEQLGNEINNPNVPKVDIAVDPLECTNHCALDKPNAIAVLAAAPRGTLLNAPDCYMDKIAGPPELVGEISLEASVEANVESAAKALDKKIEDLTITFMDRSRHDDLRKRLKSMNVNLAPIGDGDVSASIFAANPKHSVDMLMGIGAAPEGVISAVAILGMGGVFEGQLKFQVSSDVGMDLQNEQYERACKMVSGDLDKIRSAEELCTSKDSLFVATGVCSGYLPGVVFNKNSVITESHIIDVSSGQQEYPKTSREF